MSLPTGPAILEIAFDGFLNDKLVGFYRSTYTDVNGVDHVIATTQFENTDARRAFPCWDEPSFKATFQVNLTVPSELKTYSNSPVESDVDLGNGQRTVSFRPTMIMSTYLVAFVVGAFEESETIDVDGIPLRVITPIGKVHLSELALEAGRSPCDSLATYFDIRYPGEKLDMIAIPDFLQRGDGESRTRHLPRECTLGGSRHRRPRRDRARRASRASRDSPTCGSATSSPWSGGKGSGSTKPSPPLCNSSVTNAFRPEWRSGPPKSPTATWPCRSTG